MELTELKKTWDKLSSNRELNEDQLKAMLGKRTKNLFERIERNIKIGFVVLFVLILVIAFDDFIISPMMVENINLTIPNWLLFLGVFSNTLIFTTFIYFVIKYYRVKRSCDVVCELKYTLIKIIDTLNIYQRLFYLALISLTFTMALGFITGLYQESIFELEQQGMSFSEIILHQLLLEIAIGFIFIVIVVGGIFLFLRWGFRRLYGNYYHKLKRTLKELEEIEE
jgi:hypothetical protein